MAVSNIDLRVDSRQAVSGLKAAQKQVGLLNGATKGLLRTMGPLTVAFTGVALVRNYFKGFNEAEKATQALKTLGANIQQSNQSVLQQIQQLHKRLDPIQQFIDKLKEEIESEDE